MAPRRWLDLPRRLGLLVFAVMLLPTLVLGWWSLELWGRLQTQRVQERVEFAADRIVSQSHQLLSDLERDLRRLASGEETVPPPHTVFAVAEADRITVAPAGGLIYVPGGPTPTPSRTFLEGERYELQADLQKAIDWFRARARTDDPSVRAGALLRLGRTQRKAGQFDAALGTFTDLEALGGADIEGLPAAMLALVARCDILEETGRTAELTAAADVLEAGLSSGAWTLTRDAYDYYLAEARRRSGRASETDAHLGARAVAAAFHDLHARWVADGHVPERQWLTAEGRPILAASIVHERRLLTLLAGANFLEDAWGDLAAMRVLLADGGRPILGAPLDPAMPQAVRTPDVSKLPWTLRVASPLGADPAETVLGRRLLLAGLAAVLILFGGSAYFTIRGISRELATARLQADFVAAVSHEFRTPLASVRHLSDMLVKGRIAHEADRQLSYTHLSRESERLERLVEDLLDFGRFENGAYQYRFEPLDAGALLTALVAEFQAHVASRGHRVELSLGVAHVTVVADRDALSRVVWNLLDNAVKYSPGRDTVWVDLAIEDGHVAIRVRDHGLGIAPADQRRIFQKFVRASHAQSEQIKGTGIGLAMVRHIVDAHRGEVRVDSQPNRGSTFTVRLPMDRPRTDVESAGDASMERAREVPASGQG
jgi:signal transduction histidine kinase